MATLNIKELVEPQVVTAGAMYTAPAFVTALIQAVTVYNPTAAAVPCKVAITPSGVGLADGNTLLSVTIPAGKSYLCPEVVGHRVTAGKEIRINAAGCTFAVGGTEISGQ